MDRKPKQTGDGKTRNTILHLLKMEGPMTSGQLSERLGLTAMAVRQHLYVMQSEKFLTVEERPVPLGRPAKYWQLTADADRLFPDAYGELSVSLISALGDAFGADGLQRVLESRSARQRTAYSERLKSGKSLKQKLQELARIRTEEGYMAEVKRGRPGASREARANIKSRSGSAVKAGVRSNAGEDRETFLLIENHCPICVAATYCQGLCSTELDLFRRVLGPDVEIEREEHIIAGARRCAYRITQR